MLAKLLKSFTQSTEDGNPSGVVYADGLSDSEILSATIQLGFSESAFIQTDPDGGTRLRLFSMKGEVNSCVTATLAAAYVVSQETRAKEVNFRTRPGERTVYCEPEGLLLMKQPPVQPLGVLSDREAIASLLNIKFADLANIPIEIVSAGTPKVLIPIVSLEALLRIKPDLPAIASYSENVGARGFFPFTFETVSKDADFHARQFNPQDGITEDPATGVAAAALADYLRRNKILEKDELRGEQGHIINRKSDIFISRRSGDLFVGGHVVDVGTMEVG